MKTFYLQPAQFHNLQAVARDWLDNDDEEQDLEGLADDLQEANGTPACIDEDDLLGVMDVTDWHVRIESMDEDFEVRPLPLPGSWYDPALDPSNAPAAPRGAHLVLVGQEIAGLQRILQAAIAGRALHDYDTIMVAHSLLGELGAAG